MNAFQRLGDHRAHAQQVRALGRPVARGPCPVFLAGDQDHRYLLGAVALSRVEYRHLRAVRLVQRRAALNVRCHLIFQTRVGKSAAHHHIMVEAARAVVHKA